jgi:hypothetical protein
LKQSKNKNQNSNKVIIGGKTSQATSQYQCVCGATQHIHDLHTCMYGILTYGGAIAEAISDRMPREKDKFYQLFFKQPKAA